MQQMQPGTHGNASLLQLLKDPLDVDGEGEWELAAPLLRVGGRDDVRCGSVVWPLCILAIVVPHQVLQVAR